jgi:hypothetical protein
LVNLKFIVAGEPMERQMDYLMTNSPISKTEMNELVDAPVNMKNSNIDGVVISNIIRTCHECGLKKSELMDLSVGDVSKGGKVKDTMRVGKSELRLSERSKGILQEHLDHLKKKGYPRYSNRPLFPTKDHKQYYSELLDNHFREAKKGLSRDDFTFEKIRQAGICNHYDEMMNNGSSAEECLAETKSFARISESHLNGVLKDKKQQTGKKVLKGKEIDYLKAIDEIIVDREGSIQKLEELKTEVMMEESFGAKLKEVFSNWIDSKINDAKNVEPKEVQNFNEYETSYLKRLKEAIDSLMCSEVRSEDDVDAAEVIRKYFFSDDTK